MKHTPGPWYVEDRVERTVIFHEGTDHEIASVHLVQLGDDIEEEQLANAELIALAPEMAAVLKQVRDDAVPSDGVVTIGTGAYAALLALLARIEAET